MNPLATYPYFIAKKLKSKDFLEKPRKINVPFGLSTFQGHDVASCADFIVASNTGWRIYSYLVFTYPYSRLNANRSASHSSIFQYDKIKRQQSLWFLHNSASNAHALYGLTLISTLSYHRSAPSSRAFIRCGTCACTNESAWCMLVLQIVS